MSEEQEFEEWWKRDGSTRSGAVGFIAREWAMNGWEARQAEVDRLRTELEQGQARFTPHQCCEFLDGECAERRRCLLAVD